MSDIIQLLPDNVANQIAAGEVVQRPASAVKELLENSIDASASKISLIVKDAGKTLIQIIDDGSGMSVTDARMCFERHATSKIKKADDLFALQTKGFRGEALASIAAIAHVELKTRREGDELGTHILIEGSQVISQEPCSSAKGTSISVKNLFYNVPARRNFLKANGVEMKHVIEEFERVALIHPEVEFSLHNGDNEVFNLKKGSFRQRIVAIFGDKYNQRLVPVEEETDILSVSGFVGKPEFAKKTRGEQYFFVNNRFIKSAYLNHAIQLAFEDLISKDQHPSYFLQMQIDPSKLDVNIHPTKTEVKFEDERSIYAIVRTSVKQALGKFNIAPSLDFEQETAFNVPHNIDLNKIKPPTIQFDPEYNPFELEGKAVGRFGTAAAPVKTTREKSNLENWQKLYDFPEIKESNPEIHQQLISANWDEKENTAKHFIAQLANKYILTHIKSGLVIIDQNRAHQRILYERYIQSAALNNGNSQQLLFPLNVELSSSDFELVKELKSELNSLGFDINEFGKNTFVINGVPTGVENISENILEELLEQFKMNEAKLKLNKQDNLARSLSRRSAIKEGARMTAKEMESLVDELFACEMPYHLPNNKPIIIKYSLDELDQRFEK